MDLFLFLVITIFSMVFLLSFSFPSPEEEEEEVAWSATEQRLEMLLQSAEATQGKKRDEFHNQILAMGPTILPHLSLYLSQELFLNRDGARATIIMDVMRDFGLRSVPILLDLLEEEGHDQQLVLAVQELLIHFGPKSMHLFIERYREPLEEHIQPIFLAWGAPAARRICKELRKEPKRDAWKQLLPLFGKDAVEPLQKLITEQKPPVKDAAFEALARIAPVESRPLFLEALTHKEPKIRASSVFALGQIGDQEDFEILLGLLEDVTPLVRIRTISALVCVGGEKALEPLTTLKEKLTSNPDGVLEALHVEIALSELGEDINEFLIEEALNSMVATQRMLALELIERLPFQSRVVFLERLLWHPEHTMSEKATLMLAQSETTEAAELLVSFATQVSESDIRLVWTEQALLYLGDLATSSLVTLLENEEDEGILQLAVRILLAGSDPQAVGPLLLFFDKVEEHSDVWDMELDEFSFFLERVAEKDNIAEILQRFLQKHPLCSKARELQALIDNYPDSAKTQRSLALDVNSPTTKP